MSSKPASIKKSSSDNEKSRQPNYGQGVVEPYIAQDDLEAHEVFKKGVDGVDFRTVGWPRASVIFLKSKPHPTLFIEVFMLTTFSHFRYWSSLNSNSHVFIRFSRRRSFSHWMGSVEYLHSNYTRRLQKPTPRMSFHR